MSESLFSYKTLCHAIAGSCGSVSAMSLALPLDTARTRLVLDDSLKSKNTIRMLLDLINEEGTLSLFRGGSSTLQAVAVSNFVYFYTFHGLKKMAGIQGKQSAVKDLISACIAGTINVLMTNPLWVVNLRLKMQGVGKKNYKRLPQDYKGLIDGLIKLGQEGGMSKLWSGTASSLVLVSNPTIKFTVYEFLKRMIARHNHTDQNLSSFKAFLLGALASAVATTITYPIQVVQTKSRYQSQEGNKEGRTTKGMLQMTLYLNNTFGSSIFFKGLEAKLIQSILTAGFMFLTYEKILLITQRAMGLKAK